MNIVVPTVPVGLGTNTDQGIILPNSIDKISTRIDPEEHHVDSEKNVLSSFSLQDEIYFNISMMFHWNIVIVVKLNYKAFGEQNETDFDGASL